MSETIDLHDAMLAELRQFGEVLAACIVVTPIANHGSLASHAYTFADARADMSPGAPGAGASEPIDQIKPGLDPDLHPEVLDAARQSLASERSLHQATLGRDVGSAGA